MTVIECHIIKAVHWPGDAVLEAPLCAPVQRCVTFGRGSCGERCSGGKPGVAFNNMVSARWRTRTEQGASLVRFVVVDD
jgi:hypothetical protein